MLSITSLVMSSLLVTGQVSAEQAFNAYAELAVGGTWVAEVDGKQIEDRYERILNGKFVQLGSKGSEDFPDMMSILGIDAETKKFTWWGFGAKGLVTKGTMEQESDNVWVSEWSGNGPNGKESARARVIRIDADTVKYEILEQRIEGDVKAFPSVTIWKRKR